MARQMSTTRRRGAIAPLLLLSIVVLFAATALVWNTGVATDRKVHAQTAADSTAHSIATLVARSSNLVAASNRLIVRRASAAALLYAVPMTVATIDRNWKAWAAQFGLGAKFAYGLAVALEGPMVLAFVLSTALAHLDELASFRAIRDIDDIKAWQASLLASLPPAADRLVREESLRTGISLHACQPGRSDGRVRAPIRRAGLFEGRAALLGALLPQVHADRRGWERELASILIGRGPEAWRRSTDAATFIVAGLVGQDVHVLETTRLGLEFSPTDDARRRLFSVVVVATARPPGTSIMMPGLYDGEGGRRPTAIAQAEAYLPFDSSLMVAPWRVWSLKGWMWHARLARADALPEAAARSTVIAGALRRAGVDRSKPEALRAQATH